MGIYDYNNMRAIKVPMVCPRCGRYGMTMYGHNAPLDSKIPAHVCSFCRDEINEQYPKRVYLPGGGAITYEPGAFREYVCDCGKPGLNFKPVTPRVSMINNENQTAVYVAQCESCKSTWTLWAVVYAPVKTNNL